MSGPSCAAFSRLYPESAEDSDGSHAARHREAVAATAEPTGGVNVNTADRQTLCTLPGVGEVLAQRILDTRNECGGFAYPEDLLLVKGIGTKKLEALRPLICFK